MHRILRTVICSAVVVCLVGRTLAAEGVVLCTTPDGHARIEMTFDGNCALPQEAGETEPCRFQGTSEANQATHTECTNCLDTPLSAGHAWVGSGSKSGTPGHRTDQLVTRACLAAADGASPRIPLGRGGPPASTHVICLQTTHLLI